MVVHIRRWFWRFDSAVGFYKVVEVSGASLYKAATGSKKKPYSDFQDALSDESEDGETVPQFGTQQ
jgi:hypothetical protein